MPLLLWFTIYIERFRIFPYGQVPARRLAAVVSCCRWVKLVFGQSNFESCSNCSYTILMYVYVGAGHPGVAAC